MVSNLEYAPIVLFTYNRLDHVKQTIEALKTNPEAQFSKLFIFSDAGKNQEEACKVAKVREYLHTVRGFGNIEIIEHVNNYGIEKSEIEGISSIVNKFGRIIVLEDDIVVGNQFLKYINLGLNKYEHEPNVFSITGYSFISSSQISGGGPEFAFIPLTSAWGWATWKDRWNRYKAFVDKKDLSVLKNRDNLRRFDFGFIYSDMLLGQYMSKHYTWDLLWYWCSYINKGLTLAPIDTMVNNIGMDGTGVHYIDKTGKNRIEKLNLEYRMILPQNIEEDDRVNNAIISVLSNSKDKSISASVKRMMRRIRCLYLRK